MVLLLFYIVTASEISYNSLYKKKKRILSGHERHKTLRERGEAKCVKEVFSFPGVFFYV